MTPARWGGFAVLVIVVVILATILLSAQGGACAQAKQAYTIAITSPDPQDRATALTLYYLKKGECEAAGGTVGE